MDWARGQFQRIKELCLHRHLHVVVISSNRKRKATLNAFTGRVGIWTLQCAAGEHGLLGIIKGNGSELLPVADELVFNNDFVDSKFSLTIANRLV